LSKAAERGHAGAQFLLGIEYKYGHDLPKSELEAAKWFLKAAEQGVAQAQVSLSFMYYGGEGVPKNEDEALKWGRKAAAQGNRNGFFSGISNVFHKDVEISAETVQRYQRLADLGDAAGQVSLGNLYAKGDGVMKDEVEAVKWYRKAAEQGRLNAQFYLGQMYDNGQGVPEDDAMAVKWYRKAAEQGAGWAQYHLGLMFKDGHGVLKDDTEAVKWFRKAATGQLEHSPITFAQVELGRMYANGQGVLKDDAEALKWLREASDHYNHEAQFYLGRMYANGQGVLRDMVKAEDLFFKASLGGNIEVQLTLGSMYATGDGVAMDEHSAATLFRKAAEQGNAVAQKNLGIMYARGKGVLRDEAEAVKWLRKAAEQGEAEAQNGLGVMCATGQGVPKDETLAYKWFLLADSQGNANAKKGVALIESTLTPTQRSEGQRMARDFHSQKALPKGSTISREGIGQTQPESTGTGFFITDNGYLITNQHVASEGAAVRVLTSNGAIEAKVVKVDKANDLALLKADGKFNSLPVISSRGVRLGATAATVGFPNVGLQGFSPKLAKGEVASLAGAQDDARHFQISVPVQPGNSGGALVDERGNVIGVVKGGLSQKAAIATSGTLAENVNYAVKSSYLLSFLESVPEVSAKLKEPITTDRKFEDVIKDVGQAAVLVLVY